MQRTLERADEMDRRVIRFMDKSAIPLLRISLAITYLWFGSLKIIGKSPISGLVSRTIFFIPGRLVVPFLGFWEVAVGLGLLLRFPLRLTLFAFFAQIAGTFMVLFVRPREAFQKGNPLLLTNTGEFVIKNLVLASAGLAVGSKAESPSERIENPAVDQVHD